MQLMRGYHRIALWADIVTLHPLPGISLIETVKKVGVIFLSFLSVIIFTLLVMATTNLHCRQY